MSDSSQPSLAVIISCAAVGGLIFIFLAIRIGLYIHHRRHKSVPLPPARPLAALHTLPWNANRNASSANFSGSKLDLSSPTLLSPTTYQPDLSMAQHRGYWERTRNVHRQYSGSTLNTEEIPLRQPPSPSTRASSPMTDAMLAPPQPSFFPSHGTSSNRSSVQLSFHSSTEEPDIASYPPQRQQSITSFPVDPSTEDPTNGSGSTTPYPPSASPRMNGTASRRHSLAASVSTTRSTHSTRVPSVVRGPPHKPYSRIEIVLPSPLAPQSQRDSPYLHQVNERNIDSAMNSKQTVCDPWLRVGRDSSGPVNYSRQPSRERERRHRAVSSESQAAPRSRQTRLASSSSVSSFTTPNPILPNSGPNSANPSRTSSSSQIHTLRHQISLDDTSELPPVPRVPSMYTNTTNSPVSTSPSPSTPVLALSDSITGNGKMRGLESDSSIRNKALPSSVDITSLPDTALTIREVKAA